MNTKAMPVLFGSARSSCVNASKPPADAPTATIAKESVLPLAPALSCVSVALRLDEEGRVRRLPLCLRVRGWFWLFDCRGGGGLLEPITIKEPLRQANSLIPQKALKLCRLQQDAWAAETCPMQPPRIGCLILLDWNGEFGAA